MKKFCSRALCLVLCLAMLMAFAGCSGSNKTDAFVVMTEALDGLFNPFFYTSATDGTIVGMTQISMLGASYKDGKISVAYGDNEAVVTKDYDITENADGTVTYRFVLKNGIKFSDGQPLTMEDVLFNYYVYLDPVYTGSNTLYSTDIVGLGAYRTQTINSGSGNEDENIANQAAARAAIRLNELINLFNSSLKASATKEVSYDEMKAAILAHKLSSGYKSAISNNAANVTNQDLLDDYEYALKLFKEELLTDYHQPAEKVAEGNEPDLCVHLP